MTYENDAEGIAVNFRAVGNALSKVSNCENTQAWLGDDWKQEIETYREKSTAKRGK